MPTYFFLIKQKFNVSLEVGVFTLPYQVKRLHSQLSISADIILEYA